MNSGIIRELERCADKYPDFKAHATLTVEGVQLTYNHPRAIQNIDKKMVANAAELMQAENDAVRELEGFAIHIIRAFPNVDWPKGATPGGQVIGLVSHDRLTENHSGGTLLNAFLEVRLLVDDLRDGVAVMPATPLPIVEHREVRCQSTALKSQIEGAPSAHRGAPEDESKKKYGWIEDASKIDPAVVEMGNNIVDLWTANKKHVFKLTAMGQDLKAKHGDSCSVDDVYKNLRKHWRKDGKYRKPPINSSDD